MNHQPTSLRGLLEVFNNAIELDASQREAFLEEVCADDSLRRHELGLLLASYDRLPDGFLESITNASEKRPDDGLGPGAYVGAYELIRELGRGGMSRVYLARDTKLGRRVAIKFMHKVTVRLAERFLLEARATARCNHENIVVIHEVAEHRGTPFIVLEYLQGRTLAEILRDEPQLPVARVAQLMVPVVRALACAHEKHIIHRDLKPENIFVTNHGTVKVVDFGIAKFVSDSGLDSSGDEQVERIDTTVPELADPTRKGALVGTYAYMAPEQWNSHPSDHRTDLWAVGVILYRMLIGRHPLAPLRGFDLSITRLLEQPMPSAHGSGVNMPHSLAELIDHCLQKHTDLRPSSASAVLDVLESFLPARLGTDPSRHEESPYTGLSPFEESDAHRFFGRSHDIAAVLARLRDQPLIGVIGPSGVGKSSFVRAGLIPALKYSGSNWDSWVIRPGRAPMMALARLVEQITAMENADSEPSDQLLRIARRLRNEPGFLGTVMREHARERDTHAVLFVDQFEELYTLTEDKKERIAFTRCLAGVADDPSSPLRLVLSLRSDFLDRVAEDRAFIAELHRGLYVLTAPDRDGLREALVRPAEMEGYRFESVAMVEHMLDALAPEDNRDDTPAGALPLLQFAATKLWEARDRVRRLLPQSSYEQIGGIYGALASHADAVVSGLVPPEQSLVQSIFLHLVTPQRTRILTEVVELRALTHDAQVIQRLLEHLVNARLLVVQSTLHESCPLIEIVHESLIHSWPQLSHWLDEHQEDLAFIEQLRNVARRWHNMGRPRGLLWRGEAMEEARRWRRRYRGELPTLQRDYLQAVLALARRSSRRKRLAVYSSLAFLSVLVIVGTIVLVQIRQAEQAALAAARESRRQLALATEARFNEQRARKNEQSALRRARTEGEQTRKARDLAHQRSDELTAKQNELRRTLTRLENALAVASAAKTAVEDERAKLDAANLKLKRTNGELERLLAERQRSIRELNQQIAALKLNVPKDTELKEFDR